MIPSKDLFELIKSLSTGEQRHFKLFASRQKGEKIYLKLFEVIENQQEYDEKKILKKFQGEKFIQRLPIAKSYLHQLILQSLDQYSLDKNKNNTLKYLLRLIEVLDNKGLYKQCDKLIEKAKKIAESQEAFLSLAEVLRIETLLMHRKNYIGKTEQDLDINLEEIRMALKKNQNKVEYIHLTQKIFMRMQRSGGIRSEEDYKGLDDIMKHPLLQDEKEALSSVALGDYYKCHMIYNHQNNNYEAVEFYSQKKVEIDEASSVERHPYDYIFAIHDHTAVLLSRKQIQKVPLYISKIREYIQKNKNLPEQIKARGNYIARIIELEMFRLGGEFEKGIILSKQTEAWLKENKVVLNKSEELTLSFVIAYMYFGVGNYTAARQYLHRLSKDTNTQIRTNIIYMAKILNLIVNFELEEENLEYIVRATYRFLYKREQLYKYESVILGFIRRGLPKIKTQKELMIGFKDIHAQLVPFMNDPHEREAFHNFDIISWLESKIENKSFVEVIRNKIRKALRNSA